MFHCADLTGPHWVGIEEGPIFSVTSKAAANNPVHLSFCSCILFAGQLSKSEITGWNSMCIDIVKMVKQLVAPLSNLEIAVDLNLGSTWA